MSSWRYGLLETMKDPKSIMMQTNRLVAIKDKYPKAKFHFLIIPYESIDTVFDLNNSHVELLEEMALLGLKLIESIGQKNDNYLIGFHAEPSMIR